MLVPLPISVSLPRGGIRLWLRLLASGALHPMNICPVQNHMPWEVACGAVDRGMLAKLSAACATPWCCRLCSHCCVDLVQEDSVQRMVGLQN